MGDLLFSANGRLGRNRFWQGLVILTVASVLITAGSVMVNTAIGLLSIVLIFPYVCIYAKRLHDAGFTGWFVILIWFGSLILNFMFGLFLGPFLSSPETVAMQEEIVERINAGDVAGAMEGTELLSEKMLPLSLISTVLVNVSLALIVGSLRADPKANQYGPPPGHDTENTFN
ncbi:MAG: DUF805 domain-containing protein [Pseudomonadota bacterium]